MVGGMHQILDLREDILIYLHKHGLIRAHSSLNTELLEPKHRLIYSFRIDKKYRALFICLPEVQNRSSECYEALSEVELEIGSGGVGIDFNST
jgi:hypothetical protein